VPCRAVLPPVLPPVPTLTVTRRSPGEGSQRQPRPPPHLDLLRDRSDRGRGARSPNRWSGDWRSVPGTPVRRHRCQRRTPGRQDQSVFLVRGAGPGRRTLGVDGRALRPRCYVWQARSTRDLTGTLHMTVGHRPRCRGEDQEPTGGLAQAGPHKAGLNRSMADAGWTQLRWVQAWQTGKAGKSAGTRNSRDTTPHHTALQCLWGESYAPHRVVGPGVHLSTLRPRPWARPQRGTELEPGPPRGAVGRDWNRRRSSPGGRRRHEDREP